MYWAQRPGAITKVSVLERQGARVRLRTRSPEGRWTPLRTPTTGIFSTLEDAAQFLEAAIERERAYLEKQLARLGRQRLALRVRCARMAEKHSNGGKSC